MSKLRAGDVVVMTEQHSSGHTMFLYGQLGVVEANGGIRSADNDFDDWVMEYPPYTVKCRKIGVL